jgi:hypothetical protein
MVEGYQRRDGRAWRRIAQLAAWMLSPYSKKPLSAARLLGSDRPRAVPRDTDD